MECKVSSFYSVSRASPTCRYKGFTNRS